MRKFPEAFTNACSRRVAVLGLACSLACACVNLGKRDAFPVASQTPDLTKLRMRLEPGGTIRALAPSANGRPVEAYYEHHARARGTLVFFGGSGNQLEAPLETLGPRTAALGLDLVVFSYYHQGEEVPSVARARTQAKAVFDAARAMHTPASRSIYLLGYSLGGWFALDLAANENIRGLVLVGAETTQAEVIRKTDVPWASLVAIRPDLDARQLDASLYAPRVRAKTLVVTSRQDEAVPASVGQAVYAMIPATTPKRLVVLDGVTHGRYFLSDEFWRRFAESCDLKPEAGDESR